MVIILHDDWSIILGENRSDQPLKHLAAILTFANSREEIIDKDDSIVFKFYFVAFYTPVILPA